MVRVLSRVLVSGAVALLGCGGSGESSKRRSFEVEQVRQSRVDKVDLLFMIDNSMGMAEKQRLLAEAVPVLIDRFLRPRCIDENGIPNGSSSPCPPGSSPEFVLVEDIHVGIITSSLGDHGSGDACSEASAQPGNTFNDGGRLVPTAYDALATRSNLPSWDDRGFLVWDPRSPSAGLSPHSPPGYGSPEAGNPGEAAAFFEAIADHVASAGELGCTFEAQLESWYRFLVDPEPVEYLANNGRVSVRGPVNQTILAQRAAFLRPDSLLAIIMLTDENDCSVVDEDDVSGWLVPYTGGTNPNTWRMPRSHAACATNPNDPNCWPCGANDPDPGCMGGAPYTPADDPPALRCYRQKRRFGIDLLYPTSRYVEALTRPTIDPRYTNDNVPNPIFSPGLIGAPPRDPGLIFLAGIVGVPWQDLATAETLNEPRALEYLTADELSADGRWAVILGDPEAGVDPTDPFMVEAVDPRPAGAANPVFPSAAISPTDGTELNPINGHEQAVIAEERSDLQFACIFDLATPAPCDEVNESGCQCNADEYGKNSPLCSYPAPDMDGTQERVQAYPSLRQLEVLKGMGANAVVASICPKNVTAQASTATDPHYGYNPAMNALVDRVGGELVERCFPRSLPANTDLSSPNLGRIPCRVVEVLAQSECDCARALGRLVADPDVVAATRRYLQEQAFCGAAGQQSCDNFCMCEIAQYAGDELRACQNQANPSVPHGFCYLEEDAGAHPALLTTCPADQKHRVRFIGENLPRRDSLVAVACPSGS